MREIKFRAWDKEKSIMRKVEEITFHENGSISGILAGGKGRYYLNKRTLVDNQYIDDVILMQYMGIQDVNGKEIYEGDIVFLPMVDSWEGDIASFEYKAPNYVLKGNKGYYEISIGEKSNPKCYEVIGNIYENPELLKVIK